MENLIPLPAREGFPFKYERSRPDRNALFVLNKYFGYGPIAAVRTKWHRANLSFTDLRRDLLKYDVYRPPRRHRPSYFMALESVKQDLGLKKGSIVPLTTGAASKHPDIPLAKSPGLPYKLRGYHTKGEALADPGVLKEIRQKWYDIEANKDVELADVCCFARAQICSRDKNKVRATWGYPLEVYLAEAQWFYPCLEKLKAHPNPIIAYGVEMANGGMTFVNDMVNAYPTNPIFMGDWKEFDKLVPAWLIRDAFRILEDAIDFNHVQDVEGKVWNVRPWRSRRRWRKMVNYFINTPIRMSDGTRYIKNGGVPSGSCWTNIVDSIINAIIMRYLVYEATGSLPLADEYMGDDSVMVLKSVIVVEDFARQAYEEFGMKLNTEKSSQTQDRMCVNFLGYYNRSGYPYKQIDSIIASTIYPERTVLTKVDTISRLIGQAFSTFDLESAKKFLQAAHYLMDEERLTSAAIEEYMRLNPIRFKFLATLGIDVTTISIPVVDDMGYPFRVLPSVNRRRWSHRNRDEQLLYMQGVNTYQEWTNAIELDPDPDADEGYYTVESGGSWVE